MKWSALDQSPVSEGRRNFRPSGRLSTRQATMCVWALAADTAAQAWTYDPEARRHSYALLAEAFELHAESG
jgi:hypothetical protein